MSNLNHQCVKTTPSTFTLARKQRGVGLIEVMVTVLLLSTSLLSLAVMQNRSLQFNQEAYLRSQANILAYDIIDRARANLQNVGDYNLAFNAASPAGADRSQVDLATWRTAIQARLPAGDGQIECVAATRACTVSLRWRESEGADAVDEGESTTTTFTYETLI